MKNHVALLGCGQFGSRHLQALARSETPLHISVFDPNEASLALGRERLAQVEGWDARNTYSFTPVLGEINTPVDVALVACGANHRADLVSRVLETVSCKAFILEKVIYQSETQGDALSSSITKSGAKAWVNCPMRTQPFFAHLRERVDGVGPLSYAVFGGRWGLACNAVHFIDTVHALTGEFPTDVDIRTLDKEVIESRRAGFFECSGTLGVTFDKGTHLSLTCRMDGELPLVSVIQSREWSAVVDDANEVATLTSQKGAWKPELIPHPAHYQSRVTHLEVESILKAGECGLTPFETSRLLHRPMLAAFKTHFSTRLGKALDACPIT